MTMQETELYREELVRRRMAGSAAGNRLSIGHADRSAPLRLSFGQRQQWFLNRLDPGSPEYLVPLALRLRGPLDTGALKRVWAELVARHEILRTRYELAGDEPAQLVDPPAAPQWTDIEVADEAAALARAEEEALRPFDLEREHPLRLSLLRIGAEDHLLLAVFHHIASDEVSQEVLLNELGALYVAFSSGRPSPLPPPAVQYADYAAWQRDFLSDQAMEQHLWYWRDQLADLPRLELPTDHPRPPVRGWRGASVPLVVPAGTADRLRELARAGDATPFMVLLTAFQCLLARYTGQDDVTVGTVVSGRNHPELEGLLGYVMNSLALRMRIAGEPSFEDMLARNRVTVLEALDRQAVPFSRLVDELQPERDMSITPLFQVAFTLHALPVLGGELAGVRAEYVDLEWQVAKFDLALRLAELPDGSIGGHVEYATDLFDEATARRLAEHYSRLLESIAADPRTGVHELDVLPSDERSLLVRQAGRAEPDPVSRCLHEVFAEQAARTPDAVAVTCDGAELSYTELDRWSNRLAHHLRELGAAPETLVGVCLDRGVDLVPTLLGVTKSGAGYLPLDPAYPADRLRFMLEDAAAPLVVTTAAHLDLVREVHKGRIVVLDGEDATALDAAPVTTPEPRSGPENLAYVIYTSGSTGKPKGVCVTHANVHGLLTAAQLHYGFGADDSWSMFHSYAFDVSVWEMWGALLHGGKLVVVPFTVSRSPEEFLDLLVRERVTVLSQTPSAFRALVAAAEADDPRLADLALSAVVFAGEKLEQRELVPWVQRFGLSRPALINMYGITETCVHSTFYALTEADLEPGAGNPVGYPLDGERIHLLDRHGNLVPTGMAGEMHVGGHGVARGYLGRPELTAERFVPDPFGAPGDRLYRSGDLARRLPDGSLEFLGRIDHQVKLRGFRIELGEIAAALGEHPAVRDAVVVLREDTPGDKRLVAYLVAGETEAPDPGELRALVAKSLPDYMIPAAYVVLDRIPLTTNGKLDRRALPEPDAGSVRAAGEVTPPRTVTEARMASIWRDTLDTGTLGVHDGFFEVGGDSIRAVALVGALRSAGFDVSVRDIFEYRTVAQLAAYCDERSAPAPIDTPVEPFELISAEDRALVGPGISDAYPMSQVQTGMLVEMLAGGSDNIYHNISSFQVKDEQPFDFDALRDAASLVVERHEILRTSLHANEFSVPMQLVHTDAPLSVGMRDLRGQEAQAQQTALRKFTAAERAALFDLARPPLIRVFAHVVEKGWWISITECHAVLEGWSFHSLLMEILTAYGKLRDGRNPELAALPEVRYADFIAAELASLDSAEDRGYWRELVARQPKLELPQAWRDPEPGLPYRIDLPCADLVDGLRGLATSLGVSIKAVWHAAYLKVMSMLTDQGAFSTGLVCDTRPELLGADRVFGMYLNTVPFPYDRSAGTWRELIQATYAGQVELWPHRRFPLPEMHRDAGAAGSSDRLIETFFIYLDFHVMDLGLVDGETVIDDSPNEFGLTMGVMGDRLMLHARTDVVRRADGDRLIAMFRAVLEAMVADPGADARETCLPAGERELVLNAWNHTEKPLDSEGVVERVRAVAGRQPDAVAVSDDRETLTYGQLVGRASAISGQLADAGPGSLVAVLADPGARFVTAVLGVLGAGAAYIPLDTAAPEARSERLLTDSGARFVLVTPEHAGHAERAAAKTGARIVLLGDEEHQELLPPRGDEHDLAYVLYTSGSTGAPKGAMVHRRGMVNHLLSKVEDLTLTGTDSVVQNAPLTFDVSIWQMLAALLTGGRVRVVTPACAADPAALFGTVEAEGISVLEVVPSLLRAALDDWDSGAPVPPLGALRWLVVTGEALPPELCTRWFARFPGIPMVNAYGPTECSDDVTHAVLTEPLPEGAALVPIGRAIRNTRLYVLDGHRRPAPIGVPGELYVGGEGVGHGYLGDPERTAQAFVPDPFTGEGLLYRTGDRVRYRPDGQLEFIGRRDNQVKIRGQRVELGEVEAALRAVPGVRDAAAKAAGGRLIGYLVGEADREAVRAELAKTVPEHLVPSALLVLDALPLTANGKVDRKALPDPDRSQLAEEPAVAPRTATERRIAEVWGSVLGVAGIGVTDDFFAVGGDSIRTLTVVAGLRSAGFTVSVRDVFETRTIEALAARLESSSGDSGRALAWLRTRDTSPPLYCVHPQGGSAHWFLPLADRMGRSVAAFEAPDGVGEEPVDLTALAARYLGELRPEGRFALLGWSSGATLAWEMARRLADARTPASALILIDPIGDPAVSPEVVTSDVLTDRLAELCAQPDLELSGEVQSLLRLAGLSADTADLEAMRRQVYRARALTEAMYTYRYPAAGTPIRLVITDECAEERHGVLRGLSYPEYLNHWRELAGGGLTVHRMAGEHEEALRPRRAGELAALIQTLMSDGGTR
ncbi:amino acid adenylation domain-containing protein [Amycolatopsis magusensis]|uniref:amino acid adenylation domain-containing protein n=1 Tax=Amycolatopsis magusensis TaxID=882444 RepID=UPI0037BA77A4